jgi:hypothetical protein
MQYSLPVELLMELLRQLDQGVNADAGGLRKNPASAYACTEMVAGGSNTVRVGACANIGDGLWILQVRQQSLPVAPPA